MGRSKNRPQALTPQQALVQAALTSDAPPDQPKLRLSNKQVLITSTITGETFPSDQGQFCITKNGDFAILPKASATRLAKTGQVTTTKE